MENSNTNHGCVHIYYGGGKGKTTAGMGLALRAAGYGYNVLIYQFMKGNHSSERNILEQIPNITLMEGYEEEKFSFQMTDAEKEQRRRFYRSKFDEAVGLAAKKPYQLLFLDEILYTINAGLFDEQVLLDFLDSRPEELEVVLSGSPLTEKLKERADYVTEIRKIKHPYDEGLPARFGIEK